jgi:capsular exopolysaccharide synthesis family protein
LQAKGIFLIRISLLIKTFLKRQPYCLESLFSVFTVGFLLVNEVVTKKSIRYLVVWKSTLSSAKGREIKTILVTSSKPSEGKTVSAINLAFGLSETNDKVVLLDGNLHKPCLHKIFNVSNSPGLSDFFTSNNGFNEKFLRETESEQLSVMPCGTKTEHSVDVYKAETFKAKLDSIKQNFDYVILDGESILPSSKVPLIAKHFDGIIMVVECEKTKWEVAQQAKEKLINVGGNILGVVMNKRQYYIPLAIYK